MTRRSIRALIYLLVVGQLLLLAPVSSAFASPAGGTSMNVDMPCADSMPPTDDSKPCPCCPDGIMDMAGCLSTCAANVGMTTGLSFPVAARLVAAIDSPPAIPPAFLADPPLKPPPIV